MPADYDRLSGDHFNFVPAVTAYPISMACWFRSHSGIDGQTVYGMADTGTNNNYLRLAVNGNIAGNPVQANARNAAGNPSAFSVGGYTVDSWDHMLGVFANAASRKISLNAETFVEETTPFIAPAGVDSGMLGHLNRLSGKASFFDGDLGWCTMWSRALTQDDSSSLHAGLFPLNLYPDQLFHFHPHDAPGTASDWIAGVDLTTANAPAPVNEFLRGSRYGARLVS